MTNPTTASTDHEDECVPPRSRNSRMRYVLAGLLLVAVVAAVMWMRVPDVDELISQGETAFAKGYFPAAHVLADEVLGYDPESQRALLLKGRSDARMGRDAEAIELLNRVVDDGSDTAVAARCVAGDLYLL